MADRQTRFTSLFIVLLIVAFPVVFMWQGLDVTDTGYYLVNCQQFFHAYPKDFGDAQVTSYWLTHFIGACWYKMNGDCGLIGFRVLYVLMVYAELGLVYVAVRGLGLNALKLLTALLAAEVFCVAKGVYVPTYNHVTTLFFTASAIAFYYGLVRRNGILVFVGGFVAGISVFARMVNFPIILLGGAAWYYSYIRQSRAGASLFASLKASAAQIAVFVLGFFCGIAATVVLIAALGHLEAFRQMARGLFAMAADRGGTGSHGATTLLKGFAWDYFHAGLNAVCFIAVALLVGVPAAKIRKPSFRTIWILICAGVLTVPWFTWPNLNVWAVPAILYVILLAAAFGLLGCSPELALLCILAAVVLFVTPLGSADGIYNGVHAMYLAVPVALMALMTGARSGSRADAATTGGTLESGQTRVASAQSFSVSRFRDGCERLRQWLSGHLDTNAVAWACMISLIGFSAAYRISFTYRDSSDRRTMRTAVDHPKLRYILTTPSRARCLDELLSELKPLVRKDDYLLDFMQFPMIYFLTQTKPYLYTSWANIYEPQALKDAFQRALSHRPSLPVCVKTRVDTSTPGWPDKTYPPLPYYRHVQNRRTVEEFLQTHAYHKIWQNAAFEIWIATDERVDASPLRPRPNVGDGTRLPSVPERSAAHVAAPSSAVTYSTGSAN